MIVRWAWVVGPTVRWLQFWFLWVVGHGALFLMELWVSVRVFTDLLVEGCESNLVVVGWWVVGLGCIGSGVWWVVMQ